MYIFSSWFQELIEYLKTLPEFNIDDIKNSIENENILKGRIDIYLKYTFNLDDITRVTLRQIRQKCIKNCGI